MEVATAVVLLTQTKEMEENGWGYKYLKSWLGGKYTDIIKELTEERLSHAIDDVDDDGINEWLEGAEYPDTYLQKRTATREDWINLLEVVSSDEWGDYERTKWHEYLNTQPGAWLEAIVEKLDWGVGIVEETEKTIASLRSEIEGLVFDDIEPRRTMLDEITYWTFSETIKGLSSDDIIEAVDKSQEGREELETFLSQFK